MAKGSSFERRICRLLSEWWDPAAGPNDDVLFWRTAGSGGRATVRARSGKRTATAHCGDICATDDRGAPLTQLVSWELKNGYPRASLHALLDQPLTAATQLYEEWIDQAFASSTNAGTPYWLILHKRDRRDEILVGPTSFFQAVSPRLDFAVPQFRMVVPAGRGGSWDLTGLPLALFLEHTSPDEIRALWERLVVGSSHPNVNSRPALAQ